MKISVFLILVLSISLCLAQPTIGTFVSVTPGVQTAQLVLPATHTFQYLNKQGDIRTVGGATPTNHDFTGYVPISGSSTNGYVSINHENVSGAVTVLDVNFNSVTKLWNVTSSTNISFSGVGGTAANCSGGITPWGTVITCEETDVTLDLNFDGYYDLGWHTEINPATKTVIAKRFAMGRMKHENICVASDQQTCYFGADDATYGYVYKFVANTPANLSAGTLYVLERTGTTGTWKTVPNTTIANRNNTNTLAQGLGATNFNGVEDVEIGTLDGKIYFTSKSAGRVYRFTDNGATISNFETFVETMNYNIFDGSTIISESWGTGNDNLAFDGEGNLWVLQDGGRNHIWMVKPGHTTLSPQVELFGKTPAGSEPTGITFTPDYKFMFISFQHPNSGNNANQSDVAGTILNFNVATTVVISRKENFGLPVSTISFMALPKQNQVELQWKGLDIYSYTHWQIERSTDSQSFTALSSVEKIDNNTTNFTYTDKNVLHNQDLYYRIKFFTKDGNAVYSEIKSVKLENNQLVVKCYPNPVQEQLTLHIQSPKTENATVQCIDIQGKTVKQVQTELQAGSSTVQLDMNDLPNGSYTIIVSTPTQRIQEKILKQ